MCSVRLTKPRLFLSVILFSAGTDHAVRGWDEWSHRSQRDHPVALHADRIQGTSPRARRDITLHYLLALASLLWVAGYCTRPYILGNIFIQLGPHGWNTQFRNTTAWALRWWPVQSPRCHASVHPDTFSTSMMLRMHCTGFTLHYWHHKQMPWRRVKALLWISAQLICLPIGATGSNKACNHRVAGLTRTCSTFKWSNGGQLCKVTMCKT